MQTAAGWMPPAEGFLGVMTAFDAVVDRTSLERLRGRAGSS